MWPPAAVQLHRGSSGSIVERPYLPPTGLHLAYAYRKAAKGSPRQLDDCAWVTFWGYSSGFRLEREDPAANRPPGNIGHVACSAEIRYCLLWLLCLSACSRFHTGQARTQAPCLPIDSMLPCCFNIFPCCFDMLKFQCHFWLPGIHFQHVMANDLRQTYVILVNEVREQTAEASNTMIDEVLRLCAVSQSGVLHLWSDCGPHFRSMENLAHHLELCRKRHQTVTCSFLAEQHGKNILDSAFGAVSRWLQNRALKKPVHTVQHLLEGIKEGAEAAVQRDPKGPAWKCHLINFGRYRAKKNLVCTHLWFQDHSNVLPGSKATTPSSRSLWLGEPRLHWRGARAFFLQLWTLWIWARRTNRVETQFLWWEQVMGRGSSRHRRQNCAAQTARGPKT